MRTTIDRGGRVVIPKAMRDELQLAPGGEVEVSLVSGRIEIEPAPVSMRLEELDGVVAAVADGPIPKLTVSQVRCTLDQVRR